MNPRALQSLRGATAASIATFVALFGHILAGGEMPRPVGVLVPWMLALLLSVALIGRRLSLWRLTAVVVLSQSAFHGLFVLGAGGSVSVSSAHGAHELGAGTIFIAAAAPHAVALPALLMLSSHLAAAALTTMVLYRAERIMRGLLNLVQRLARAVLSPQLSVTAPRHRAAVVAASPARGYRHSHDASQSRRGPPCV